MRFSPTEDSQGVHEPRTAYHTEEGAAGYGSFDRRIRLASRRVELTGWSCQSCRSPRANIRQDQHGPSLGSRGLTPNSFSDIIGQLCKEGRMPRCAFVLALLVGSPFFAQEF